MQFSYICFAKKYLVCVELVNSYLGFIYRAFSYRVQLCKNCSVDLMFATIVHTDLEEGCCHQLFEPKESG